LRLTFHNIYLIFSTGFEIISGFTNIHINVYFWCPCLKILGFPGVDLNAEIASIDANDISNLACHKVGFEGLTDDNGGAVRKRSGNK